MRVILVFCILLCTNYPNCKRPIIPSELENILGSYWILELKKVKNRDYLCFPPLQYYSM